MTQLSSLGPILAEIVEAASAEILPLWRGVFSVDRKSDDSPVTEADRRGEAIILARLAQAFPDIPVISEEDASVMGTPDSIGPRFFLVDPLDGTKAFVRGDEHFTVNIGLVDNGIPVAGAVCAPVQGRTWFTDAGRAWRRPLGGDAMPVRVRPWPPGEALALVSHTTSADKLAALQAQYGFAHSVPMDSSIKLCIIAEGSADLYVRNGPTMEWDIAAGHAVLNAAGGNVRQPDGSPFLYGKAELGFRNGQFVARGA